MRLIDDVDAINVMTNRLYEMLKTELPIITAEEASTCLNTCHKVARYEIDKIPTAYDVDKVVEELERLKDEKTLGTSKVMIKECIEIVKAGGKSVE